MLDLPSTHPWLPEKFANESMHVVRPSNRFWIGLCPNAVMCVCKTHSCAEIHSAMSNLTNLKPITDDQHKEMGQTRIETDHLDLMNLMDLFRVHKLLNENQPRLNSLSFDLMSDANCDNSV